MYEPHLLDLLRSMCVLFIVCIKIKNKEINHKPHEKYVLKRETKKIEKSKTHNDLIVASMKIVFLKCPSFQLIIWRHISTFSEGKCVALFLPIIMCIKRIK